MELSLDKRASITRHYSAAAHSGVGPRAAVLQDNRPSSIVQRKLVKGMNAVDLPVVQRKQNSTGLPDNLKTGIENLSGHSMDDVKVHYNSSQPAQLQAHAYAQGTDIHIAPGQEKHLPHEAWHVVQQKQGRVKPTLLLKGKVNVNDDEGLEKEADVMGAKALQMKTVLNLQEENVSTGLSSNSSVVQRNKEKDDTKGAEELQSLLNDLNELIRLESGVTADSEALLKLRDVARQIEEVISGKDTALQNSIATSLREELNRSLLDTVRNEKQETGSSSEQGVIQGQWWIFEKIIELAQAHPLASGIAGVVVIATVIERIIAYKKQKRLPPSLTAALFANDKSEYWTFVDHKIKTFCVMNGYDNHDQGLIRQAAVTAINNSATEGNFIGARLPAELNNLIAAGTLHKANPAATLGAAGLTFIGSLDNDIQAAVPRTINTVAVPPAQVAPFTTALRQMPFVQNLYNGTVQANLNRSDTSFRRVGNKGNWRDGGSIVNHIVRVNDGNRMTRDTSNLTNGVFDRRVRDAERIVRQMVEPAVLNMVPRPVIDVHEQNQQQIYRPWGFRAFQTGGHIHVAQDESSSVIVHEIGHHIEHCLPMLSWQDIKLLLQGRNLGQQTAGYIYIHSYEEQRFGGNYPATGKYTSKYYEGGSTEVMSMSMEYLSHPTRFRDLIQNDPQQAAIILRILRPTEYASIPALAAFNIYLPA